MVYHEDMFVKFLVALGSLSAVALFTVLQLTTPASVHPVGLLGIFILIYILITVVATLGLYAGIRLFQQFTISVFGRASIKNAPSIQRAYLYGTILAFAPVILIGMRSVGSFGFVDISLVVAFELIACFYIWRR